MSFDKGAVDSDKIMELALEAGAEDISEDENEIEVYTDISNFETLKKVFEDNKIPYIVSELSMVPQNYVKLEGKNAETMLKLMEALEDSDDVQKVHANFDIDAAEMERLAE